MNALVLSLGMESWKPLVAALLLPPMPLLLLVLVGARMLLWRRLAGWLVIVLAVTGLWLSTTVAAAEWFVRAALKPPPALDVTRQIEMQRDALRKRSVAVIVLGGGRESFAPEYGMSNLTPTSLERLRYGLWLGRELGVPVGFAGGIGHGEKPGPAEAEIAARIAAREFGRPLRWGEEESRDTRENAVRMVAMLKRDGITHVVLVTHGWHMPRAHRAFEEAAEHSGTVMTVIPAPMALARRTEPPLLRWLPSHEGYTLMRRALREAGGLLVGA